MFKTLNIFFIAALVGVLFVSCSSQTEMNPEVRIGYLQNDLHHLPVFVALEKGFFQEAGVNVTVAGIFRAGPEEMSAFASGELDVGYVGQAPATAAVLNRIADVTFIHQVNLEGSSIVVRKDSPYTRLSQLKGKTFAVPGHATMQDFLLRMALKKSNMSIDDVRIMVLKPPEMIQALILGDIDAFIAWEPYPSQASNKEAGMEIMSSQEIWQDHPCCVLVADNVFIKTNPEIVGKISSVHRRSCDFIKENRESAVMIGMKYTAMDKETVSKAISKIKYDYTLDKSKGAVFIDFLKDLRYIKPMTHEKKIIDPFYH